MSGKVSGQVWDLDLPHREIFVLLAITDHADHDGNNMHPSLELLAWKTGYTTRTIIRILNKLVERGVLERVTRAGYPSVYTANLFAAPQKAPRPKKKRRTRDTAMSRDKLSPVTKRASLEASRSDSASAKNVAEPSLIQTSSSSTDEVLSDRQKAIRTLARWHERKTGTLAAYNSYRDMELLADDYTLAQIEQAILQVGDREPQRPLQYVRKVLARMVVEGVTVSSIPAAPELTQEQRAARDAELEAERHAWREAQGLS